MKKKIAVLPGDGIGKEITNEAIKSLKAVAGVFDHEFEFEYGLIGAEAIAEVGDPFPWETEKLCRSSDAILFGAIGTPQYDSDPNAKVRPEQGLLKMRSALGLFANVRPTHSYPILFEKSPLKNELLKDVDFLVYRELTSGVYFGKPSGRSEDGENAYDTILYSKEEIVRIARMAFESARSRKKRLTLVDKANVLATSRLWRATVADLSKDYPDVTVEFMFVDKAAMKIITDPSHFDVIVTENLFGDILTNEASVIAGSMGLIPSASLGNEHKLFGPIHGSCPGVAGQNKANPIASILSTAMMLEMCFGAKAESNLIVGAVGEALNHGYVTEDLDSEKYYTTEQVGDAVAALINSDKMIDFNTVTII